LPLEPGGGTAPDSVFIGEEPVFLGLDES